MKSNELRIGNWVKSNKSGTEFQFTSMHFNDLNITLTSNPPKPLIEPIPLTEEWLGRFGAIISTNKNWDYELKIGAISISFRLYKECYSDLQGIYLDSKIKYVHQLQNLYFALTGQELEIIS